MVTLKIIIHYVLNTKGWVDILVPFKEEIIDLS